MSNFKQINNFLSELESATNKEEYLLQNEKIILRLWQQFVSYILNEQESFTPKKIESIKIVTSLVQSKQIGEKDHDFLQTSLDKLFSLFIKHQLSKDDLTQLIRLIVALIVELQLNEKDFSDLLQKNLNTQQEIECKILGELLLIDNELYLKYSSIIIQLINQILSQNNNSSSITILAGLSLSFLIISQLPLQQLKEFNSLIPAILKHTYSPSIMKIFDNQVSEYLLEAITSKSILFRNQVHFIINQLNTTILLQSELETASPKGFQSNLKALLLLFDKQKEYLLQQSDQHYLSSIINLLFTYMSTDYQLQQILESQDPLPSCTTGLTLKHIHFSLIQLRDLSKILKITQIFDSYINSFYQLYTSNDPLKICAAFIAFSTIGVYKIEIDQLEEIVSLSINRFERGAPIEQFGSISGLCLLCDFLGSKFTKRYGSKIVRHLLKVLNVSKCVTQRSLCYHMMTMIINNSVHILKPDQIQALVITIAQDIQNKSHRSSCHCLILIDILLQKYIHLLTPQESAVFKIFTLIKKQKYSEVRLTCLKIEVLMSFISGYQNNKTISSFVSDLIQQVIVLNIPTSQFEITQYYFPMIAKIISKLSTQKLLQENALLLVKKLLPSLKETISFFLKEKQLQEDEQREGEDENAFQDTASSASALTAVNEAFQSCSDIPVLLVIESIEISILILDNLGDHISLRDSAIQIFQSGCPLLKQAKDLEQWVQNSIEAMAKSMAIEPDHEVVLQFFESIQKILVKCACKYQSYEKLENILEILFDICQNPASEAIEQAKQSNTENKESSQDEEDWEDNSQESDDDDNSKRLDMIQIFSQIVIDIFTSTTELGWKMYKKIIDENIMGLCDSEDERFKLVGYNTLAQIIVPLGYNRLKDEIGEWLAYFTEGIEAESYALRQTSVYSLGLICQIVPKDKFKKLNIILRQSIVCCVQTSFNEKIPKDKQEEFDFFIDNSIAALGRLIYYQRDFTEAGPFIDLLPLSYDEEEALITHSNFLNLLEEKVFDAKLSKKIKESLVRIKNSCFTSKDMKKKISEIYK